MKPEMGLVLIMFEWESGPSVFLAFSLVYQCYRRQNMILSLISGEFNDIILPLVFIKFVSSVVISIEMIERNFEEKLYCVIIIFTKIKDTVGPRLKDTKKVRPIDLVVKLRALNFGKQYF